MGKSERLSLGEVRRAFRLVGECRDLGRDGAAWLGHAAAGVQRLLDAQQVMASVQRPGGFQMLDGTYLLHEGRWERPEHRRRWLDYLTTGAFQRDPAFQRLLALWRPRVVLRRIDLIRDRDFYASAAFTDYRQVAGVDDYAIAAAHRPGRPASAAFNVLRGLGAPRFTAREAHWLHLFTDELARLLGRGLAYSPDGPAAGLPPRLRPVLTCLLEGDGEKQAAARLGLSRHTVHEYVTQLYRHYGVHSRPELMTLFLHADRPAAAEPTSGVRNTEQMQLHR